MEGKKMQFKKKKSDKLRTRRGFIFLREMFERHLGKYSQWGLEVERMTTVQFTYSPLSLVRKIQKIFMFL